MPSALGLVSLSLILKKLTVVTEKDLSVDWALDQKTVTFLWGEHPPHLGSKFLANTRKWHKFKLL